MKRVLVIGLSGLLTVFPGALCHLAGAGLQTATRQTEHTTPAVHFTVVPPGPVTDRARLELRVAIPRARFGAGPVTVGFFLDRADNGHRIASATVAGTNAEFTLARAWWPCAKHAGRHRILYRIEGESKGRGDGGAWPMEILRSDTPSPPFFAGAWIEPGGVLPTCKGATDRETEQNLRDSVDAMHRLGLDTLVITYVEGSGQFYYPSRVSFYDHDVKRTSSGKDVKIDMVGAILSQADRHGMHVFLGLGRNGDTNLLWEFQKEGWQKRCDEALAIARSVARELWEKYGGHPSFYGWYSTHEMDDLAKSSAYYDPLADYCHSLSPDKPFIVAPAGTPVMDRKILAASHVDIFAYQDAVGSGYMPGKNTFNPENRIAQLHSLYTQYRDWHAGTDKHFWSDLEVWEMDGSKGYGGAYPAKFSRIRRQIDIEKGYVEMLTAYAYHGYFHDPRSRFPNPDPRAVRLYEEYRAYLSKQKSNRQVTKGPSRP